MLRQNRINEKVKLWDEPGTKLALLPTLTFIDAGEGSRGKIFNPG
jgi:hypothetical protein